jgi:antitoxin ParD1/3/4
MPSSYTAGEHVERFIEEQIETARHASANKVVRDALRPLEEQEHATRRLDA